MSTDEKAGVTDDLAAGAAFDALPHAWMCQVATLERGYDDSLCEYRNDLATRDRLAIVLDASDQALRRTLFERVRVWDDRFQACTRNARPPLSGNKDSMRHPWWFRLPRRPGQELLADLISEGLVAADFASPDS